MNEEADLFVPGNERPENVREHASPSGRYRLVVTPFSTGKGSWDYTRGLVYVAGDESPIAEVKRNYGCFPFLFVEGHPNGHDYLVCGEDYQGQTVVELDTRTKRDFLPPEAEQGHGFCWGDYKAVQGASILAVSGCHWACPYELRLYDFSDPMSGWPELECDEPNWDDRRWPEFQADGTVRFFDTCRDSSDDEDEDEDSPSDVAVPEPRAVKTFRREGNKLVLVSEWTTEAEKERRRKSEEARVAYDKWVSDFKASDPLYLRMMELSGKDGLVPDDYVSIGITHDAWCPDFKLTERRMCRRISREGRHKMDVEWGVDTGPVKLVAYRDGKHLEDSFYEHSVGGIESAFARAASLSKGG